MHSLISILRTVASIVFQISHGYNVSKDDDPLVLLAERATHEFSLASAPGSFFVDLLPIRKSSCRVLHVLELTLTSFV